MPTLERLRAEPPALVDWVERCLAARTGTADGDDANRLARVLNRLLPAIEQASVEPAADFEATLEALSAPQRAARPATGDSRG